MKRFETFIALVTMLLGASITNAFVLVSSDTNTDGLAVIDPSSSSSTAVGSIPDNTEGLAYDSIREVVYASYDKFAGQSGRLYRISLADGSATLVGDIGTGSPPTFFDNVEGLAYDPISDTLYGSDAAGGVFTGCIVAFPPDDPGAATCLGTVGFNNVLGLAYDPGSAKLYGVDNDTDTLLEISTVDGSGTAIGPIGFTSVTGLAFRHGRLYGVNRATGELIFIDATTGTGTLIGGTGSPELNGLAAVPRLGFSLFASDTNADDAKEVSPHTGGSKSRFAIPDNTEGLAYDPIREVVYASYDKFAGQSGRLYRISLADGSATLVGDIGTGSPPTFFDNVEGLAYDPISDTLYGSDAAGGVFTGCIVAFPPDDPGAATCLGTVGFNNVLGLAYDPGSAKLYGVDNDTDTLLEISTVDGSGTAIGPIGFTSVTGLAFRHGRLYGVNRATGELIFIDATTGTGTLIGGTGSPELNGLAAVPSRAVSLFVSDTNLDVLKRSNQGTGATVSVGSIPDNIEGLACDPIREVVYASYDKFAGQSGRLYRISLADGSATLVGDIGTGSPPTFFDNVEGLAYDPISDTLYGSDAAGGVFTGCIVAFPPDDPGAATCLGTVGFNNVLGLAYDPGSAKLYGVDNDTDTLLEISTVDGSGTAIGPIGFTSVTGLAFRHGRLYGVNRATGELIFIDATTGTGTLIGGTGSPELNGLAACSYPSICADGLDNDDDSLIDYMDDPHCRDRIWDKREFRVGRRCGLGFEWVFILLPLAWLRKRTRKSTRGLPWGASA